MENRRLDLGVIDELHAESFGEPGHRTFRLRARKADGEVSLWLEKEQVVMMGSAIEEVLTRVPEELGEQPESDALRSFAGELEARVGSLAIGYDADHSGYSVEASDLTAPLELAGICLLARRSDFVRLSSEISDIVSASRPRCVLCGTPLSDQPHFCPPSNGHTRLTRDES